MNIDASSSQFKVELGPEAEQQTESRSPLRVYFSHLWRQRWVIMAFILQRFRAQLRFFPLSQQALAVGGLLLNDRVISAALRLAMGEPQLPWAFWWAPLLGMLLWVPLFLLMDALRLERRR